MSTWAIIQRERDKIRPAKQNKILSHIIDIFTQALQTYQKSTKLT